MKNRFLIFFSLLLLSSGIMAQTTGRIGSHESITKWNPSATTSFSNVTRAEELHSRSLTLWA